MNKNDLDKWINRLGFDIKSTKGMYVPTQDPHSNSLFTDLDTEFLRLQGVLKGIRDNGITDEIKEPLYRIRINAKNLPVPVYLCDVVADKWGGNKHDISIRVTSDKDSAPLYTKKFIIDGFKPYLDIDWEDALEPVEEDE